MDKICTTGVCPLSLISWTWYIVSVIVVYALGALWYGKLFTKQWLKAADIKCACGADLGKGEKCTCERKPQSFLPMIMQFASTCMIGLMYFVLVPYSVWLSVVVAVAVSGWMKATLKFQIWDWKRFVTLASINVGYFFLSSLVFILFSLL